MRSLVILSFLLSCKPVPNSQSKAIVSDVKRTEAFEKYQNSVAALFNWPNLCTAFPVAKSQSNVVLLSNAHCLKNSKMMTNKTPFIQISLAGYGHWQVKSTLNIIEPADLAFYSIDIKSEDFSKFKVLEQAALDPNKGVSIPQMTAHGSLLLASDCQIEKLLEGVYSHMCNTEPGASGSPVLQDEKVVGVHVGSFRDKTDKLRNLFVAPKSFEIADIKKIDLTKLGFEISNENIETTLDALGFHTYDITKDSNFKPDASGFYPHMGPEVRKLSYNDFKVNTNIPLSITSVSEACLSRDRTPNENCQRDEKIELSLEKEFWKIVELDPNQSTKKWEYITDWISKTKRYAFNSRTKYTSRLLKLVSFAYLMKFRRTTEMGNMADVISTMIASNLSLNREKYNLPMLIENTFIKSFMSLTLNEAEYFEGIYSFMHGLPDAYGPDANDGLVVGAMAKMYSTNKVWVKEGYDVLKKCLETSCERLHAISPYNRIGLLLTAAESAAFLGLRSDVDYFISEARKLAKKLNHPLAYLIDETEVKLAANSELLNKWNSKEKSLGLIRLPFSPSQDAAACSLCHYHVDVPDHYYRYGGGESLPYTPDNIFFMTQ